MRLIFATAAVLAVLAGTARAESCLKPDDLSWNPTIARHFALIDTASKGCISPAQIQAYKAAMKADRQGQDGRIRTALAASH